MTQAALAERVGMPQPNIARIERGVVVPRAATLIELLEAAGYELAAERRLGEGVARGPVRRQLRMAPSQRIHVALKESLEARRRRFDPLRILRRLRRFGVRFVVIGAFAEAAQGSPRSLIPVVEICHGRDAENLERLTTALEDLQCHPRPDPAALMSTATLAVRTDAGELHLTVRPHPKDGFEELWSNASKMLVASGLQVWVASVDDLTRIRRRGDRPEEIEALELLGAVRDESLALEREP